MPRPFKPRKITSIPRVHYFRPYPALLFKPEELLLQRDEFQALERVELERSDQASAASDMGISRQTFGGILASARRKLADAVVNGKVIIIADGRVKLRIRPFGRKTNGTHKRK